MTLVQNINLNAHHLQVMYTSIKTVQLQELDQKQIQNQLKTLADMNHVVMHILNLQRECMFMALLIEDIMINGGFIIKEMVKKAKVRLLLYILNIIKHTQESQIGMPQET